MLRKTLTTLSLVGLVVLLAWPSRGSHTPPTMLTRVPFWILNTLFLLFVLILIGCAAWPRRRPKLGFCVECGYNLRGLTELRCPECNTPFEKCSAKP